MPQNTRSGRYPRWPLVYERESSEIHQLVIWGALSRTKNHCKLTTIRANKNVAPSCSPALVPQQPRKGVEHNQRFLGGEFLAAQDYMKVQSIREAGRATNVAILSAPAVNLH